MPRCIECGQHIEYCVCTQDELMEDEEASDYINLPREDAKDRRIEYALLKRPFDE